MTLSFGILVNQRLSLRIALFRLVVAIDDIVELELDVFRVLQRRSSSPRSSVLIGGVGRSRKDREFAALGSGEVERHVGHDLADFVEIDLGDEHVSPSAEGIGESHVTTLMPLACAALAAGTI